MYVYVFIDVRYVGFVKVRYYILSIVFTIRVVNNMILIVVAISMLCLMFMSLAICFINSIRL